MKTHHQMVCNTSRKVSPPGDVTDINDGFVSFSLSRLTGRTHTHTHAHTGRRSNLELLPRADCLCLDFFSATMSTCTEKRTKNKLLSENPEPCD